MALPYDDDYGRIGNCATICCGWSTRAGERPDLRVGWKVVIGLVLGIVLGIEFLALPAGAQPGGPNREPDGSDVPGRQLKRRLTLIIRE